MTPTRVSGQVRRVGQGDTLKIPLCGARRAGLSAGDSVDAVDQTVVSDPFGLLADLPYLPFQRAREGFWSRRF